MSVERFLDRTDRCENIIVFTGSGLSAASGPFDSSFTPALRKHNCTYVLKIACLALRLLFHAGMSMKPVRLALLFLLHRRHVHVQHA